MRIACCLLVGIAGWSLTVLPAAAREIYVDNVIGEDRYDGSTPDVVSNAAGPVRTIARALQLAEHTDAVILARTEQPYRESITLTGLRHSGVPSRPFVLQGNGAALDGSQLLPRQVWDHVGGEIFRYRPARPGYHQLFVDGRPLTRAPLGGSTWKLPSLAPLEWSMLGGEIYFRGQSGRIPHDYRLSHTELPVGITLYRVANVEIRNLTVQGFQLDGINAHDLVTGLTLRSVQARGNGRSGVSIGGASQATLIDCRLDENGQAQLRTEGLAHVVLGNCQLADEGAPRWRASGRRLVVDGQEVQKGATSEP